MPTLIRRISERPWPMPRASLKRDVLPREGLELPTQLLLVALDDHGVVSAPAEEVGGVLALGVHRVAGDDDSCQVGDGVQQRLEAGDLVRLLADVQLGQDQAGGVLQCGEQVDSRPFALTAPCRLRTRSGSQARHMNGTDPLHAMPLTQRPP